MDTARTTTPRACVTAAVEVDLRDLEIRYSRDLKTWDATTRRVGAARKKALEILPLCEPDMWLKLHVADGEINDEILGLIPAGVKVQVVGTTPSAARMWQEAIAASRTEFAA